MADAADEGQKVLYLCISIFLVLMAGLMSGLTLGLMSLDQVDLEVRVCSQPGTICKQASKQFLLFGELYRQCATRVMSLLLQGACP